MTDKVVQLKQVNALGGVTFLPGSFDKRFVRNITALVKAGDNLSDKQAALLNVMVRRYRRQIRNWESVYVDQ